MSKNKTDKKRKYIEVEKVNKAKHCLGKKCGRFSMFRESCDINSCFFYTDEQKKHLLLQSLAETLSEIPSEDS